MTTDPEGYALRMGHWVQELLRRASGPVSVVERGVELRVGSAEVRLVPRDPRSGVTRDPRLLVRAENSQYFDLREWTAVLDPRADGPLTSADQVDALVALCGSNELLSSSMVERLRAARRQWVESVQSTPADSSLAVWPVQGSIPTWLARLDEHLLASGFEAGWVVRTGGGDPIGVVRQLGAVRFQLASLHGVHTVQIASFPNAGWCPLEVVADWFEMPLGDATAALRVATRYSDAAFARLALPVWGQDQIKQWQLGLWPDLEIGPDPGEGHFVVGQRHPSDFLEPEDLARVGRLMGHAETWNSRPVVRRVGDAACPPIMSAGDRSFLTSEAVAVFRQHHHEAQWFEFLVDSSRFGAPAFPRVCLDDPTDYSRSVSGRFGAVPGGLVVHPLQVAQPGQVLLRDSMWIVDAATAASINAQLREVELAPCWDPT